MSSKFKFGISTTSLKDKQYNYLISCGSTSAKVILEHRYRLNHSKKLILAKHINKIEKRGIKFNKFYSDLNKFDVMAALITPKQKCLSMPVKALMNPFINKTLNDKLSSMYWDDTLESVEYYIRNNSFKIKNKTITTADINNIRFSIVWLNHCLSFPRRLNNPTQLLSKDARGVFIKSGFNGLQKIAKGNKVFLRKLFSELDEIKNESFFNQASLEFSSIWFKIFTATDRHKLFTALDILFYSGQKKYSNYPIYYLYNAQNNLDIQKIKKLYDIGYTTIKDLNFICAENKYLLDQEDLFNLLHESFSGFKNRS